MKLIFKLSPLERIVEAVLAAQEIGKTIDCIEISPAEMDALLDCPIGPNKEDPMGARSCFVDRELFICGVPVQVVAVVGSAAGILSGKETTTLSLPQSRGR